MVISGVADRVPEKIALLVYLDAFVPEKGQSSVSLLPPGAHLATVPGAEWLVAPIPSGSFGFKRPEVIALWEGKSGPHPLATLTQPLQLTGGIGRVKQKMYILGTDPARFTQFYDKVKNDPGWTVHTLPCTTFMQLEMPDELTAILLHAPYDRALLTAAAERLPPAILDQIKPRGRIVLPLGSDEAQRLTVVDKGADGQTSVRELIRVRFSRLETVV